jgi:hypothetical protein
MSTPPVNVRLDPINDSGQLYRPTVTRSVHAHSGERFAAWLVIVMTFAAAGLALYDLYLLLSGLG